MSSEIRYVLRSLRRRKGFAIVTVLTLGLGVGSATAIYSKVDWILFRGTAIPPNLYSVGSRQGDGSTLPFTWDPYYRAYSAQAQVFSESCVASYDAGNVVVDNKPVLNGSMGVYPNFFSVLGVAPALGRCFAPAEAADGRDNVVIVSDYFWKRYLDGSVPPLGRLIKVDERACTIVGVLKEGQALPTYCSADVFTPLVLHPDPLNMWDRALVLLGRTRPGVTRQQSEDALARVKVDVPAALGSAAAVKPGLSTMADLQKIFSPELYWTLLGAVAFLYAIACLNATLPKDTPAWRPLASSSKGIESSFTPE